MCYSPLLPQNEHSLTHNSCLMPFFPCSRFDQPAKTRVATRSRKTSPSSTSLESWGTPICYEDGKFGNPATHPQLREWASFSQVLSGLGLILKVSPICNWRIFRMFAKICEDGACTNLSQHLPHIGTLVSPCSCGHAFDSTLEEQNMFHAVTMTLHVNVTSAKHRKAMSFTEIHVLPTCVTCKSSFSPFQFWYIENERTLVAVFMSGRPLDTAWRWSNIYIACVVPLPS